jgi:hypothetical protein
MSTLGLSIGGEHNHDGGSRGGMRDDSWAVPLVGATGKADS